MSRILESIHAGHSNVTSSFKPGVKKLSVSKLKRSIQNILTNIKELETLAADNGAIEADVYGLMQQTDVLLREVENSPLESLVKKLHKRKQKRSIRKSKSKKGKLLQMPTTTTASINKKAPTKPHIETALATVHRAASTTKKFHNRLLKHHDAQSFLRKFELLKILHFSRGQNADSTRELAAQLRDLRDTWSKVLENNSIKCTQEQHAEDQWSEIFFGPAEHSFYGGGEQKMGDFLRVRRIWDSYLTHSKHGTSIPCGWVLPPENPMAEWQQYKAT